MQIVTKRKYRKTPSPTTLKQTMETRRNRAVTELKFMEIRKKVIKRDKKASLVEFQFPGLFPMEMIVRNKDIGKVH